MLVNLDLENIECEGVKFENLVSAMRDCCCCYGVVITSDFQPYGCIEYSHRESIFSFHNVTITLKWVLLTNIHQHDPLPQLQTLGTKKSLMKCQKFALFEAARLAAWARVAVD